MFKRSAEKTLWRWFQSAERKPLVIRGARQVGKTFLVRQFCQLHKIDLIEINLEEQKISEFERESFDLNRCINEITALTGKRVTSGSLLFIDEIQEGAKAYSRLRSFKEQRPDIPVIAAGSLLEIRLKETKQKIPVGRIEYFFLGPLTFTEFLLASGHDVLAEQLSSVLTKEGTNNISSSVHELLTRHLLDYLFVGGMPEVIQQFLRYKGDYLAARKTQQQIVQAYLEDIGRYAEGKVAEVIKDVLDRIPFEIGNKVIYNRLSPAKSTYVKSALDILDGVFLVQKVFYSSASGLPLKQGEDPSIFKTYFLDVGLYNCMLDVKWRDLVGLDYDNLLSKGAMAEQFIAQHLFLGSGKTTRTRVHYWLREKSADNAEVDFVTNYLNKIIPIEVKAGKSGRIKSLIQFMEEKRSLVTEAVRFDLAYREKFLELVSCKFADGKRRNELSFTLHNLPLYCIESLEAMDLF